LVRAGEHTSKTTPPPRDLGRSFVVQALAISALLSLIATGIQLYLAYDRGREAVLATGAELDRSFRGGFESALWEFNFPLIDALLDGVANRGTVRFAILQSSDGREWTRGDLEGEVVEEIVLVFNHSDVSDGPLILGELRIGLSLDEVNSRVWAQFLTLLVSNMAKTALAAMLLLVLFNRRVTRHLQAISQHVGNMSWLESDAPLRLDRAGNGPPDELDLIVRAITEAQRRKSQDFAALQTEITQRKKAELELRHRAETLASTNRSQAEFTYAISHDLKSPTNTIQMLLTEISSNGDEELSEDSLELLDHAMTTSGRMAQMIDDVLAYARTIEEPRERRPVDVSVLVQTLLRDMTSDIRTSGADITLGALPMVYGSDIQIQLLMQNLLSNAMKFRSPDRPLKITIQGHIRADGATELRVEDNGIGIDPDQQGKIFGLFKRLHTHDQLPGSGLGLAICERVMVNLDGQLTVTSVPNEGSVFTAVFPKI